MRHAVTALLFVFITAASVSAQHQTYLKGTEVNADQGLFLATPTSNFPEQTVGPLTVKVQAPTMGNYGAGGPVELTQPGVPFTVGVWLMNSGLGAVRGTLRVGVIDDWQVEPSAPVPFELAAKGWQRMEFRVAFGPATYNADYPVHAFVEFEYEGQRFTADPVLLLKPQLNGRPRATLPIEWKPQSVPADGSLALWRLPVRRQRMVSADAYPFAVWPGPTSTEMAPVEFDVSAQRGTEKEAIRVHLGALPPSNRTAVGRALVEYPLALPAATPLQFRFSAAVAESLRAHGARFRVRAIPFDTADSDGAQVIWERQVHATTWEQEEVDLSPYAGKEIRLELETEGHATGEADWGEPAILAGTPPAPAPFPPDSAERYRVLGTAGGYEVRLWPGARGMLDTVIGFVQDQRKLLFRGFGVRVLGDALDAPTNVTELISAREEPAAGRYRVRHRFRNWAGSFDLLTELWVERGALLVRFWLENTPPPRPWFDVHIEDVTTGPWSEHATRVYAGQGNVIQDPQAFRLSFNAYAAGTSYVGFDFANGVSLLQGVDVTPNGVRVNPEARVYSLSTALDHTLTYLPASSVWEAVRAWRDRNGIHAAPGVPKLAGRFAFDLWDGRYADTARALGRAFRYGLTDAVVVFHNWQYWGYDYRLPDIFPPAPDLGTMDEFKGLVEVCRQNGVLFAPHDNYTDWYPQATGFSYQNVISFDADGEPARGWYNAAEQTRAYHSSPGTSRAHLEANLRQIRDAFHPTAYFMDVWGTSGGSDYWTHDGQFRGRTVYQRDRDAAFAWIRDYLGDNAPQISEGGTDQAIGAIDGAQAQHLRVDPNATGFAWNVAAGDAERIPWFDFAYHDRLAMHGAGYHERYYGGPHAAEHGVYSDDYVSTEVLTGHPAMAVEAFGRDVVRKYWLLHDLMRALALQRMASVEFAGGNLHHQIVRWEGGGQVFVNRGPSDWQIDGHALPPFGFYARVPAGPLPVEAAFEKMGGKTLEWSRSGALVYLNGRESAASLDGVYTEGAIRLTHDGDSLTITALPGSSDFDVRVTWNRQPWTLPLPRQAEALDESGKVIGAEPLQPGGSSVVLSYHRGIFAYRLR